MAMVKCKECGGDVANSAKACPHCGADGPGKQRAEAGKGAVYLAVILGIVAFIFWPASEDAEDAAGGPALEDAAAAQTGAAEDCRADAQCWGREHLAPAIRMCSEAVERLAQHDAEWVEPATQRFPHVGWADEAAGLLRYMGDAVRFSNALGASSRHAYRCDFDPEAREVMDVTAAEGRL